MQIRAELAPHRGNVFVEENAVDDWRVLHRHHTCHDIDNPLRVDDNNVSQELRVKKLNGSKIMQKLNGLFDLSRKERKTLKSKRNMVQRAGDSDQLISILRTSDSKELHCHERLAH